MFKKDCISLLGRLFKSTYDIGSIPFSIGYRFAKKIDSYIRIYDQRKILVDRITASDRMFFDILVRDNGRSWGFFKLRKENIIWWRNINRDESIASFTFASAKNVLLFFLMQFLWWEFYHFEARIINYYRGGIWAMLFMIRLLPKSIRKFAKARYNYLSRENDERYGIYLDEQSKAAGEALAWLNNRNK